jgi:hypothetical protein
MHIHICIHENIRIPMYKYAYVNVCTIKIQCMQKVNM